MAAKPNVQAQKPSSIQLVYIHKDVLYSAKNIRVSGSSNFDFTPQVSPATNFPFQYGGEFGHVVHFRDQAFSAIFSIHFIKGRCWSRFVLY